MYEAMSTLTTAGLSGEMNMQKAAMLAVGAGDDQ